MSPPERIAARLGEVLGATVASVQRLSSGASRETWAVELSDPPRSLIAQLDQRDPQTNPDRRPRAREAALLRAAAAAGVPVAAVVADGADDPVLGFAWHVVERVAGTPDPARIIAGEGVPEPGVLIDQLAAALAGVHRMELADDGTLPAVEDPLALVRSMHEAFGQPHPVLELAFRELDAARPAPAGRGVVHGDFRMGNVLVGPDGLSAVMDWEIAHAGDPIEDLAWLCVPAWRFGRPDRPAAGLGSREQLVAAYERHSGRSVDRAALAWWELYGTLRWGVITVAQAFTHLGGTIRSLEHAVIGRRTCEVEWDLLEALDPGGGVVGGPEAPAPPAVHDRPNADELLDAVRTTLGDEILPLLEGRAAFDVRVALRALGTVQREVRGAPEHAALHVSVLEALGAADLHQLAAAVRQGALDGRRAELCAGLRALTRAKLEVANPRYLRAPQVR